MLVLSRKLGEKVYIGDNVCVTVVDIDRGKIRLGIEAPRDVPVYRQEILPTNQTRWTGGPRPGEPGYEDLKRYEAASLERQERATLARLKAKYEDPQ